MLDGQILNGSDRLGDWKTNSLEGWWDSPDPKGEEVERPNADGDFDLEVFYKARYVTITGRLYSQGHAQLHDAMNRFSALVPQRGRLQVSGHGPTQWADVKRASGLSMVPVTDRFAQWQARLKCPEPRKFGDANTFTVPSGSTYVQIFHWGNSVGYPVIVVAGSMPGGYVLQSSAGAEYRVTTPLVSGSPHTIDMSTGLLMRGGLVVAGGVTRADLWRVPGGSNATNMRILPITTGTATATVSLLDTYI